MDKRTVKTALRIAVYGELILTFIALILWLPNTAALALTAGVGIWLVNKVI